MVGGGGYTCALSLYPHSYVMGSNVLLRL